MTTADQAEHSLDDPGRSAGAEDGLMPQVMGAGVNSSGAGSASSRSTGAPDGRLARYRLQFADAMDQPRTLSGQGDISFPLRNPP